MLVLAQFSFSCDDQYRQIKAVFWAQCCLLGLLHWAVYADCQGDPPFLFLPCAEITCWCFHSAVSGKNLRRCSCAIDVHGRASSIHHKSTTQLPGSALPNIANEVHTGKNGKAVYRTQDWPMFGQILEARKSQCPNVEVLTVHVSDGFLDKRHTRHEETRA